jgi:hypothetical protein
VGLEPKRESCLIQPKEQGSGTPIGRLLPVIIKKSEKPSDPHGGGTARRSMMYQVVLNS